jgi:hypothetical protein
MIKTKQLGRISVQTCTMCAKEKPRDQFKRRLTLRQTQTFLQRPDIRTRSTVISKRCKDCWAKSKRKTPLTKKEIRNKIESGDIHRIIGELKIKALSQSINAHRSRTTQNQWHKRKTGWIKTLNDNLQQQVAKYANLYHSYKHNNKHNNKHSDGIPSHALLEQHRQNYEQAKQIKKRLMDRAKAGEKIDVDVQIVMYFKKEVQDV